MTHYYREADIDVMLADFGVPVQFGALTVRGIVDMPDELALENDARAVIGIAISVLFKTSAVPGLKVGSLLLIDGVEYTVRERLRRDEGAVTRVMCEVSPPR